MTKYNLEEFKKWLEEKPERKANKGDWDANLQAIGSRFDDFIEGKDSYVSNTGWKPYRDVALKWLTERERERAIRGGNN